MTFCPISGFHISSRNYASYGYFIRLKDLSAKKPKPISITNAYLIIDSSPIHYEIIHFNKSQFKYIQFKEKM